MSERNRLEQLLRDGSITRREFLARATALGIAGGVAPALLSEAAHAETPKKGGRLRMGVTDANTGDSLDPAPSVTIMQANITHGQLMNNLVEIDHEGTPIPELAESWESTPDASRWTFELRKDVEFHNGKTLEAQDVIDTYDHHRGEDSKSGAKGLLESITDIKADGKNTVVFSLSGGSADFPFITSEFHMSIFPAGTKTVQEFDKGIGTGPYMLESYNPGVRALVKRNPNYWKEGRAHFDEVETLGDRGHARAHQRVEDRLDRSDEPLRAQDGSSPQGDLWHRGRRDDRYSALRHCDAHRPVTGRQQRCEVGPQIRHRPPGAAGHHPARHRGARQRSPDKPREPLSCHRRRGPPAPV